MGTQPVLLFPLRLEIYNYEETISWGGVTRRRTVSCVRWYPDESQIFLPVSGLTDSDRLAYTDYQAVLSAIAADGSLPATETENRQRAAWLNLVTVVGATRARQLAGEKIEDTKRFYERSDQDALHQFLEQGAKLGMLPAQVSLFTLNNRGGVRSVTFLDEGSKIPRDIAFSLHNQQNPAGDNWVFDFEQAVKNGMGIKIDDPAKIVQLQGADWLLAVGYKDDTAKNAVLEELLLRFKSVGRFEILGQDTPTNNTEQGSTGFSSNENGKERAGGIPQGPPKTDGVTSGDLLSGALGLERPVFGGLNNEAVREQRVALAMNRLLWYVCTRDHRDAVLNFISRNTSASRRTAASPTVKAIPPALLSGPT